MQLFHNPSEYSVEQGNIRYMDGSTLLRPLSMTPVHRAIAAVLVIIAAVIGFRLASGAVTAVTEANTKNQASVEENLSRAVTYDLPIVTQLAQMDDQTVLDTLAGAGFTIYNQTTEGTAGLDLVKLPTDVTVADAAAMYAKGVGSLSASDAARLLNGSWTLSIDHSEGQSVVVKYADFSSGSLEAAIQSAIVAEGFDVTASTPVAVDEVGNTFQSGTVDVDDVTYTWRVSAAPLSDKYDIKGLPETASYVGIRLTA